MGQNQLYSHAKSLNHCKISNKMFKKKKNAWVTYKTISRSLNPALAASYTHTLAVPFGALAFCTSCRGVTLYMYTR